MKVALSVLCMIVLGGAASAEPLGFKGLPLGTSYDDIIVKGGPLGRWPCVSETGCTYTTSKGAKRETKELSWLCPPDTKLAPKGLGIDQMCFLVTPATYGGATEISVQLWFYKRKLGAISIEFYERDYRAVVDALTESHGKPDQVGSVLLWHQGTDSLSVSRSALTDSNLLSRVLLTSADAHAAFDRAKTLKRKRGAGDL